MESIKYNMGCGPKSLEGYINVDGLEWQGNVDVVQDLINIPYAFAENDSADEIISIEVLEHIGFKHTAGVLKEWYRILKFGGKLQIQVPACDKMMEMFVNKEICECVSHKPKTDNDAKANPDCFACGGRGKVHPNRWLFAFLGAQKYGIDDIHKNIFTKGRLENVLKEAKFKDINVKYDKYNWKLIAIASK